MNLLYNLMINTRKQNKINQCYDTYTSLLDVYFLSNSASGAIHLTGNRPSDFFL